MMLNNNSKLVFLIAAACFGLLGCSGSSDLTFNVCEENEQKCEMGKMYSCSHDDWIAEQTCEYGCDGDICKVKPVPSRVVCEPGSKECIQGWAYVCTSQRLWDDGMRCGNGCDGDVCAAKPNPPEGECTTDEKKCADGWAFVCGSDSQWMAGSKCKNGCDGDVCRETQDEPTGECMPDEKKCVDGRAYVCGSDKNWGESVKCGNGCNGNVCAIKTDIPTDNCEPDAKKCVDDHAYVCGSDKSWGEGVFCGLGCNGDVCMNLPGPDADLLDVLFLKDGSAVNIANSNLKVVAKGDVVSTIYDSDLTRYVASFDSNLGKTPKNYYRVDYDQAFIDRISDGHSIEVVFSLDTDNDGLLLTKPMSSQQYGGTGILIGQDIDFQNGNHKDIVFLPHVGGKYVYVHSNIVPTVGKYYHVIGAWDKASGKASIFVNGRLMNTVDAAGDLSIGEQKWFAIGADPNTDNAAEAAWNGKIAIARVYDAALTPDRVWDLYEKSRMAGTLHTYNPGAMNREAFRLSSISDTALDSGKMYYKTFVPYDDSYTLNDSTASKIAILDIDGNELASGTTSLNVNLKKDDVVYVYIETAANKKFNLTVEPRNHLVELPFDVLKNVDPASLSTSSDSSADPLKPLKLKYTKRLHDRALYTYSNSPEHLSKRNVNTCLTVADVTEKDVFFTFEHNTELLKNGNQKGVFGYRVTNTGNEDLFITVNNLGYQYGTRGTYLGEDEWIKFYNVNFVTDLNNPNDEQIKLFNGLYGFCAAHRTDCTPYKSENRKPITYRIPAGKYMYVLGGSSTDTNSNHMNINVFKSADVKQSSNGTCANGAVLFSTHGSTAKAEFVYYTDIAGLNANMKSNPQNGYDMGEYDNGKASIGHIGFDDFSGVVDANLMWTFNDKSPAGVLPVEYSNPYYICSGGECNNFTGKIFDLIPAEYMKTLKHSPVANGIWMTNINPNRADRSVADDMVRFHTVNGNTKENIVVDYKHFSHRGEINDGLGNWMTDYLENVTLVNQGDKDRKVTYIIRCNGAISTIVRNPDGSMSDTYKPKYAIFRKNGEGSEAGDINASFKYEVTVPAHSVKQFSVEYNLLANSVGNVFHRACLDSECDWPTR